MYHNIKKNAKNWIIPIFAIFIPLFIFRNFLMPLPLSSGDWLFLYPEAISQSVPFFSWDPHLNGGMGNSVLDRFWFDVYARLVLEAASIIPWNVFEKLLWFIPYISLTFISAFLLAKKVGIITPWVSGTIYSTNSYILLIISGGQLGIMAAYSLFPLVSLMFLDLIEKKSITRILLFSLSLALLIMLDLRVGYIFLAILGFLSILFLLLERKIFLNLTGPFLLSALIVFMLHLYWILPIITSDNNPADYLSSAYTSVEAVNFFSFSKFEYSLSLLHANWPENIFGKTEFLRPEFLMIPILAFLSLLGIKRESQRKRIMLLVFVLLAIIGAFLAKGTNEPFGVVYQYFFKYMPGFVIFRDPSKWYILIALSYSILIPYSLQIIFQKVKNNNFRIPFIFTAFIFLVIWIILIREAFIGNLKGTFAPEEIPSSYRNLYEYISKDDKFYRTFWIPGVPTYGYTSIKNPAIHANYFYNTSSPEDIITKLHLKDTENLLRESAVRYIIIPEDYAGKLFLTDRKYDESIYKETIEKLREINYLQEVKKFGKIVVFELDNPKDHFWSPSLPVISYKFINPTKYQVSLKNIEKNNVLVFSEKFDKNWVAYNDELIIRSVRSQSNLNSFVIPKDGDFDLTVFYVPQKYASMGLTISFLTLISIFGMLIYLKFKK